MLGATLRFHKSKVVLNLLEVCKIFSFYRLDKREGGREWGGWKWEREGVGMEGEKKNKNWPFIIK